MSNVNVLAGIEGQELPEPRGFAWYLNDGGVEYTEDAYCPVSQEEWSTASALYDADQVRDFARAAFAELVEAATWAEKWMRDSGQHDGLSRLRLALANVQGPQA